MARLARIVIPNSPHHIAQTGNRRRNVFFSDADYETYIELMIDSLKAENVRCLAWCLLPANIQMVVVPSDETGLARAVSDAHRRHARTINEAKGWTGFLFNGRFASFPMSDTFVLSAMKAVDLAPVRAKLVKRAKDWPWSSARAHITGVADGLTNLGAIRGAGRNWRETLAKDLTQGNPDPDGVDLIEKHSRTGRPLGDEAFIDKLEAVTGRALHKQKPGPKPGASKAKRQGAKARSKRTASKPASRATGKKSKATTQR
jgi:putative transposase